MPTPRYHFGTAVYQNKIFCIGGGFANGSKTAVNEVYHPATDSWETKAQIPTADMWMHANALDGAIYVVGGSSSTTWVYDPAADSWSKGASMPVAFFGRLGTSVVMDGKIHVFGGNFHQVYDPNVNNWVFC